MSIESYAKAVAAFQADIPHVGKSQTATVPTKAGGKYTYDFADLADITAVALPLLAKHGLSFTAHPTMTEGGFVLRYLLLHADGYGDGGDYPLPDPTRTSAQELGSAITYARRYTLCASTGIAPGGEDDDGQKAQASRSSHAARPARQQPAPVASDERQEDINQAKARVVQIGKRLRLAQLTEDGKLDLSDLEARFAEEHNGLAMRSAGLLQLQTFADDLERLQARVAADASKGVASV